jgi:hypothetical protein
MTLSATALSSLALQRIGAHAINSFSDGTVEANIAGALYQPIRDGLISSFPWTFATEQATLAQLTTPPLADYDYAFALPNDFLRAISAGVSVKGSGIRYRIYQNALHCNFNTVNLTYIFRPLEANCPAFFDTAIIARLAAEFCIPLTESTARAQLLYELANQEYARARQIDSMQETPNAITDFTLVEARRT